MNNKLILLSAIFVCLSIMMTTAYADSVTFSWIENSIVSKSLNITVNSTYDLDLLTVINETNFDATAMTDVALYHWQNVSYDKVVQDTEACTVSFLCDGAGWTLVSGSTYNCSITNETHDCDSISTNSTANDTCNWNETCATGYHTEQDYRNEWVEIAIVSEDNDGNGGRQYNWTTVPNNQTLEYLRLDFNVPVTETIDGFGSRGTVYLRLNGDTYVDKTNSSWWNNNWERRRPINLSLSAGSPTQTGYQSLVNVTYDSDMNSDFSDIRFVNGTHETELSYYLVDKTDSAWARFFVKSDTALSTTPYTVYMYYKNAGASSTSNPNTTFEFYDPFDGTSLDSSEWVYKTDLGGTVNVSNGYARFEDDDGGAEEKASICTYNSTGNFSLDSGGYAIDTRIRHGNMSSSFFAFYTEFFHTGDYDTDARTSRPLNAYNTYWSAGEDDLYLFNTTPSELDSTTYTYAPNIWRDYSFEFADTDPAQIEYNHFNDTVLLYNDTNSYDKTDGGVCLFLWGGVATVGYYDVDYIQVRQYNPNATYSIGAEESPPTIDTLEYPSSVDPTEGSTTTVILNFTATDVDTNIDNSSAVITITDGTTTYTNSSCVVTGIDADTNRYECNIDLNYYDNAGTWDINASVCDLTDFCDENTTESFTYNSLKAFDLSSAVIDFGSFYFIDPDITVSLQMNNTGNTNVSAINVTGYDLQGQTDSGWFMYCSDNLFSSRQDSYSYINLINATELTLPSSFLYVYPAQYSVTLDFLLNPRRIPQTTEEQIYSANWVITV